MRDLRLVLTLLLGFVFVKQGHSQSAEGKESGYFSLGVRSTSSFFTDAGSIGSGVGGQFRIRMARRINTEWFADYLTTELNGFGFRRDAHIGWSVLFYWQNLPDAHKFRPYFVAGHCFDYTYVGLLPPATLSGSAASSERWSSAVQMGVGAHYYLTERFDISLLIQYMSHLGSDIHTHVHGDKIELEEHKGSLGMEGHLLTTLSLNYRIADLWGK